MKRRLMMTASVLAALAMPLAARAQGVVRGAEEGAAAGNRAAGPVGGAVGAGVGGVVGGIEGGVKGMLGMPQRNGSTFARDRSDRAELTANQITNEFAARTARIKSDLRLTPEQEKSWPRFESATNDLGKRNADRQVTLQAERAQRKAPLDTIEQMREEAKFMGERSADRKALADAAQPLYASLDDQQKRRFAKQLFGIDRWPGS